MKKQNRHFPRSGFMSECVRRVTSHWDWVKEFNWRIQFLKVFFFFFFPCPLSSSLGKPWVWGNYGRQSRTEKPDLPQSVDSQSLSRLSDWTTNRPRIRLWACAIASVKQTLPDPMDCRLPGSSAYGILQARILEWFAMLSSRGFSWSRYGMHIFHTVLYHWTIRVQGSPLNQDKWMSNAKMCLDSWVEFQGLRKLYLIRLQETKGISDLVKIKSSTIFFC